jgi:hypothetical protein
MANKKGILEEALLDAKRIQEALNANSKEILRSVTREEIDSLVKESLEEDYIEEDVDDMDDVDVNVDVDADDDLADGADVDVDVDADVDVEDEVEVGGIENSEEGDDLEGDYESGMDAIASEDEVEMDMTMASDEDVISVYRKLTGDDEIEVVVDDASGEIKLNVNEPGEFVIKTKGENSDMGMDAGAIDIDGMDGLDVGAIDVDVEDDIDAVGLDLDGMDAMGGEEEEEYTEEGSDVMYEIALDEDTKIGNTANGDVRTATSDIEKSMTGDLPSGDIDSVKAPVDSELGDNLEGGFDDDMKYANAEGPMVMSEDEDLITVDDEEDVEDGPEVAEQISVNRVAQNRAGGDLTKIKGPGAVQGAKMNESKVIKKYNTLLTEAKALKGKNNEYKEALKQFRTMLAETVVFNSNLTYVTKLFMEHSTTKEEKEKVFKRFDDEVSTLKESKKLYKSISSELSSRKIMNESIGKKFIKENIGTSQSTQLTENTVYVDRETSRVMDLIKRVEGKNK